MSTSYRFSTLLDAVEIRGKEKKQCQYGFRRIKFGACGGNVEGRSPKALIPKDVLDLENSMAACRQVGSRDFYRKSH